MLRKNMPLAIDGTGTITVGAVTVKLKRIGVSSVTVAIDAPREMQIKVEGGESCPDTSPLMPPQ